ncbi:ankyrin repeat domain-containing protein [Gynuella sunshinyii]|nr:ankyrin repeat domain-containing protein [Gynuella sunshinyii]
MNQIANEKLTKIFREIEASGAFGEKPITSVDSKRLGGDTPLHIVSVWGNSDYIDCLLKNGSNINLQGEEGYTALMYAVEQGNIDAVRILISNKAEDLLNNHGDSAMDLAAFTENESILSILRTNGYRMTF